MSNSTHLLSPSGNEETHFLSWPTPPSHLPCKSPVPGGQPGNAQAAPSSPPDWVEQRPSHLGWMPQTGQGGFEHSGGHPLQLWPQSSVSTQQRIGRWCCKRGGSGKLGRKASEKRALPCLGGGCNKARQGGWGIAWAQCPGQDAQAYTLFQGSTLSLDPGEDLRDELVVIIAKQPN